MPGPREAKAQCCHVPSLPKPRGSIERQKGEAANSRMCASWLPINHICPLLDRTAVRPRLTRAKVDEPGVPTRTLMPRSLVIPPPLTTALLSACSCSSPHLRLPLLLLVESLLSVVESPPLCSRFCRPAVKRPWIRTLVPAPHAVGRSSSTWLLSGRKAVTGVCGFPQVFARCLQRAFSRHAPLSLASAAGDQKAPTFGSRVFGRAMRRSRPRPTGRDEEQAGRKAVRALFLRTPLPLEHRHPSFLSARLELLLQRREPQCLSHVMGANRLLVDACVFVRSSIQKLRPLKATPSTTLAKRRNQRKRRQSEAVFRHSAACGAAVLLTTPTQTLTKTKVSRSDV